MPAQKPAPAPLLVEARGPLTPEEVAAKTGMPLGAVYLVLPRRAGAR